MSWLREKFKGYPCALTDDLIDSRDGIGTPHDDWPPGLQWIPRSWNARGPRCGKGKPGYMTWPPRLIEGYGVSRWETDGSRSIIEIPILNDKRVDSEYIYGRKFFAIERKKNHPNEGKEFYVKLDWTEGMDVPGQYHPSALQRFSDRGYMVCDPSYRAYWYLIERRLGQEDLFWFLRTGWRMDSLGIYYNRGPMFGRKMD